MATLKAMQDKDGRMHDAALDFQDRVVILHRLWSLKDRFGTKGERRMRLKPQSCLRMIKSCAVALLLAVTLSAHAFADCSTGSDNPPTYQPTCSYVPLNTSANVTPTAFTPAFPTPACEKIYNGCPADIMVPTSTQAEWTSFFYNHESCVGVSDCSTSTCNPSSIANGSVDPSTCAITCDSGYTLINGVCQPLVKICNVTAGGHGSINGTIWDCVCNYYYNTSPPTPYSGPDPSGDVQVINQCTGQPLCGSNVTVNGDGSTSGTLCAVGSASAVSPADGTYTCVTINMDGASNFAQCQAQTVVPECMSGADGLWCAAGTMTHYDEGGTDPENWHCTGINAPDALCHKNNFQPPQPP